MIRVQSEPFDPAAETSALIEQGGGSGAIATFVGIVRKTSSGVPVASLYLDHYPGFTEQVIETIGDEARSRFPLLALRIIHRHGRLGPGAPIVFVGAAAEHRRAALQAVDYMMDRLKTEAPFWKKESGPQGSRWIEPTKLDHEDRARWESD